MTINFGIIGPGAIADDQHAPALAEVEGARLWSVLSRDSNRAKQFADQHYAAASHPVHVELDSFLSDPDLHAVIICTPDKLHTSQTVKAAEAGKHVFTEKPMATDVESCRTMIDACQDAGVRLGVAYHHRWHSGHRLVREALLSQKIGELRHMRVHWTFHAPDATNWRASSQTGHWWSLAANGTHCLDLIRWLMIPSSGEVEKLTSLISQSVWNSPHDETAVLSLRFKSGATAESCTSVLFPSQPRIEIYGTEGSVICDGTLGRHGGGTITINETPLEFIVTNPFAGEIRDFVAAIHENRAPEVDGNEGLENIKLLTEAARKSGIEYYAN